MNYPTFGYNPRFAPQMAAPAFYGAPAPVPAFQPASAPAPQNGQNGALFGVQPVTSREEAVAVIADPLSAGVLLPDLAHGVIYVKRFNPNTGASDFGEFQLVQPQQAAPVEKAVEDPEYVTRRDFEEALSQLRSELAPKAKRKEAAADE